MCGITGVVSTARIDQEVVEAMMESLSHRGPDARGVFMDATEKIGLGHTRLSIIDLSAEANQPFHSADGNLVIAFNGEVYNFMELQKELQRDHGVHFRTHSDTEVIVEGFAVWGRQLAEKLDGMFAIAIVDRLARKLFLFRDRLGKKPLYYFHSSTVFAFASEIKSLLRHPIVDRQKEVSKEAISNFLHLGYIPEPHTVYANIHKFPAGHAGMIGPDLRLEINKYWNIFEKVSPPSGNLNRPMPANTAKSTLGALLEKAVRKRLISDVPLGTFLSGGTDSSLITAIATRHTTGPLPTFSIGFQENKFDESGYAREVSRHLGTQHTELMLKESDSIAILEQYLDHFDEPFADTSAIPTMLVSRLARKEVKVVLTGDGGDELFQGYGAYTWADRLQKSWFKTIQHPLRWTLRTFGNSRLQRVSELLKPVKEEDIRSHIFSQEQYFFRQEEIRDDLLADLQNFRPFRYQESIFKNRKLTGADRQALFDLQYYLKDDLLVKVDRASMLYALECRCPLLDDNVVEFALSLDHTLKKRDGMHKWILKELLGTYLPDKLVNRPKWGFSIPLAKWLRGDLHYLLENYLSNEIISQVGLCNASYVDSIKKEFLGGKEYLYNRLWGLIVLHRWWKKNLL